MREFEFKSPTRQALPRAGRAALRGALQPAAAGATRTGHVRCVGHGMPRERRPWHASRRRAWHASRASAMACLETSAMACLETSAMACLERASGGSALRWERCPPPATAALKPPPAASPMMKLKRRPRRSMCASLPRSSPTADAEPLFSCAFTGTGLPKALCSRAAARLGAVARGRAAGAVGEAGPWTMDEHQCWRWWCMRASWRWCGVYRPCGVYLQHATRTSTSAGAGCGGAVVVAVVGDEWRSSGTSIGSSSGSGRSSRGQASGPRAWPLCAGSGVVQVVAVVVEWYK